MSIQTIQLNQAEADARRLAKSMVEEKLGRTLSDEEFDDWVINNTQSPVVDEVS